MPSRIFISNRALLSSRVFVSNLLAELIPRVTYYELFQEEAWITSIEDGV